MFISDKIMFCDSVADKTITSTQLNLSFSIQSCWKEGSSFSGILTFFAGRTVSCFLQTQSFKILSTLFGNQISKIPFYHYTSVGIKCITEGITFNSASIIAHTDAFSFGTWQKNFHGTLTMLACKAISQRLPFGNVIIQHSIQDCTMIAIDLSFENLGWIEKRDEYLIERIWSAEAASFRMKCSTMLTGVFYSETNYCYETQDLKYNLLKPRKPNNKTSSKEFLTSEMLSTNGVSFKTILHNPTENNLDKNYGVLMMASNNPHTSQTPKEYRWNTLNLKKGDRVRLIRYPLFSGKKGIERVLDELSGEVIYYGVFDKIDPQDPTKATIKVGTHYKRKVVVPTYSLTLEMGVHSPDFLSPLQIHNFKERYRRLSNDPGAEKKESLRLFHQIMDLAKKEGAPREVRIYIARMFAAGNPVHKIIEEIGGLKFSNLTNKSLREIIILYSGNHLKPHAPGPCGIVSVMSVQSEQNPIFARKVCGVNTKARQKKYLYAALGREIANDVSPYTNSIRGVGAQAARYHFLPATLSSVIVCNDVTYYGYKIGNERSFMFTRGYLRDIKHHINHYKGSVILTGPDDRQVKIQLEPATTPERVKISIFSYFSSSMHQITEEIAFENLADLKRLKAENIFRIKKRKKHSLLKEEYLIGKDIFFSVIGKNEGLPFVTPNEKGGYSFEKDNVFLTYAKRRLGKLIYKPVEDQPIDEDTLFSKLAKSLRLGLPIFAEYTETNGKGEVLDCHVSILHACDREAKRVLAHDIYIDDPSFVTWKNMKQLAKYSNRFRLSGFYKFQKKI